MISSINPASSITGAAGRERPHEKQAAQRKDKNEGSARSEAEETSGDYSTQLMQERRFGSNLEAVRDMVMNLMRAQGLDTTAFEKMSVEEAGRQIADDGYWGVEQTSDRIFQFAVDMAGGDPERLDRLKAAIRKGFEMAQNDFGGSLPEISYKTIDRAMEKLDGWAEGLRGASEQPVQHSIDQEA